MKTVLLAGAVCLAAWMAQGADVQELWKKNCASCHGPDGKGKTKAGREAGVVDLTDAKVQEKFTDEAMFKAVKEGVKEKDKTKMKPAERLNDKEIKRLIAHVRTLKK
ncbi:MAG: cytochrome c [Verrucomicrobia bacterium]|nr:cytochrome c [Verrucomicrobiota bacterium]